MCHCIYLALYGTYFDSWWGLPWEIMFLEHVLLPKNFFTNPVLKLETFVYLLCYLCIYLYHKIMEKTCKFKVIVIPTRNVMCTFKFVLKVRRILNWRRVGFFKQIILWILNLIRNQSERETEKLKFRLNLVDLLGRTPRCKDIGTSWILNNNVQDPGSFVASIADPLETGTFAGSGNFCLSKSNSDPKKNFSYSQPLILAKPWISRLKFMNKVANSL